MKGITMNNLKSINNETTLVEVSKIANLFRVTSVGMDIAQDGTYIYKAALYSKDQSLNVTWLSEKPRVDIQVGSVVRGGWITKKVFAVGTNIIDTLYSIRSITETESLTSIIEENYVYDYLAYWTLFEFINGLPVHYKKIIDKALLQKDVLKHFLKSPYSTEDHLPDLGGVLLLTYLNLVCLFSQNRIERYAFSREVTVTAIILLGIANYNRLEFDTSSQSYINSEKSVLHSNTMVALELLTEATKSNAFDKGLITDLYKAIETVEFIY